MSRILAIAVVVAACGNGGAPHKEATADGWMFSQENPYEKGKDRYVVEVERYVGDGALFCQGQVWPMARSKDDVKNQLLPLVEKMCASLKAK